MPNVNGQTSKVAIWTIGHSVHTTDQFLNLLSRQGIEHLIDIRRFPNSKRNPQFAQNMLKQTLNQTKINYTWLEDLGGYREKQSPEAQGKHRYLRVAAFRNYAAYMETDHFLVGLRKLKSTALHERSAIMCAEAKFWQCHRSILSDRLQAEGLTVLHILDEKTVQPHRYTDCARILGTRVIYDKIPVGTQLELLDEHKTRL